MKLLMATHSRHKLTEVRALLPAVVEGLEAWPAIGDIPETAETFEGNALLKARAVFAHTGLPCVADDSGLVVDALGGAPGVHSKRYTPEATAQSNNTRLLAELEGRTDRRARFVCAMALVWSGGERVVRATCEGTIARAPRGSSGFGYDPLFLPEDAPGRTMAELSAAEKNAISHRGRAFSQLPALMAEAGLLAEPSAGTA